MLLPRCFNMYHRYPTLMFVLAPYNTNMYRIDTVTYSSRAKISGMFLYLAPSV